MIIAVVAVAFLGALQVINTEAIGNESLMEQITQKVLVSQASSGVEGVAIAPLVESGVQPPDAEPLESRAFSTSEFAPSGTSLTSELAPKVAPAPDAAASTSPEASATGSSGASPDAAAEAPSAASPNEALCKADPNGEPFCIYAVQEGDTLWSIADTLGFEGTYAFSGAELIALSNGLNDAQNWLISIGQELHIPNTSGVIHTVGDSETISVLAELYGITPADVIRANGITDANSVTVGQTLLIPSPNLWPISGPAAVAEGDEAAPPPEATEEATAADAEPTDDPAPEATAVPETAAVERPAPSANANPSVSEIRDQFAAGYIAANGPPEYLEFILARVIPCESGYNLRAFNPAGPFYGLMQFLPQTWANTGGGDWFDAWQQGHNTAVLLHGSHPSTQWPSCWR